MEENKYRIRTIEFILNDSDKYYNVPTDKRFIILSHFMGPLQGIDNVNIVYEYYRNYYSTSLFDFIRLYDNVSDYDRFRHMIIASSQYGFSSNFDVDLALEPSFKISKMNRNYHRITILEIL